MTAVGRVAGNTETTRVSPAPRPNSRGEPEQRERLGALGAYQSWHALHVRVRIRVRDCQYCRNWAPQEAPPGVMPEPFGEFYRAIRGGGEAMYRDWWK